MVVETKNVVKGSSWQVLDVGARVRKIGGSVGNRVGAFVGTGVGD